MKYFKFFLIFVGLIVYSFSCTKKLDVENLNQPDLVQIMQSPDDVKGVASSLLNGWFQTVHGYNGPALSMWAMSDNGTCSWGTAGMKDLSSEPRMNFVNTSSSVYRYIIENYWKSLYSINSSANDVLWAIELNEMEIGEGGSETNMIKAVSYMCQGLAVGYLALVFDKVYLVDETTKDILAIDEASTYQEATAFAVKKLEKAIAIFEAEDFVLPDGWIPGDEYTSSDMASLAHSFVVRLLVYKARNASQNSAVDWSLVLDHAKKGIQKDFAPLSDDETWYSLYHTYAVYPGWGRVDMRVINMMDPTIPLVWPDGGYMSHSNLLEMNSTDKRAVTDFQYLASNNFRPERGLYHFSSYRYSRLDQYITTWKEPMRDLTVAENELFIAEAYCQLGNLAAAADVINAGTRVTRGELPVIGASVSEVKDAIWYERNVELILSGMGIQFFDMRRHNQLQSGTLLHFPIPAEQLEIMGESLYTFGGNSGIPGEDVSIGGWK
ncbi:MAG: RagB/SusD family nutrient uptake outer membrane protein [Bacteroidota bacterium]